MSEMTEPDTLTDEETWEEEQQEKMPLSRRPRRRLLTPLTALLFAVLLGAGGFIAGVQVEKGEAPASTPRGGARLASQIGAGAGAPRIFGAGPGGGATAGEVANVSGSDLYVTDFEGNTVKVKAGAAQITRQVKSSVRGVHPGDTVLVQGTKNADGSIEAQSVRDSGSAEAGLGGLFGGGGGSAAAGGGGNTAGAGNGGGEVALFGKR